MRTEFRLLRSNRDFFAGYGRARSGAELAELAEPPTTPNNTTQGPTPAARHPHPPPGAAPRRARPRHVPRWRPRQGLAGPGAAPAGPRRPAVHVTPGSPEGPPRPTPPGGRHPSAGWRAGAAGRGAGPGWPWPGRTAPRRPRVASRSQPRALPGPAGRTRVDNHPAVPGLAGARGGAGLAHRGHQAHQRHSGASRCSRLNRVSGAGPPRCSAARGSPSRDTKNSRGGLDRSLGAQHADLSDPGSAPRRSRPSG